MRACPSSPSPPTFYRPDQADEAPGALSLPQRLPLVGDLQAVPRDRDTDFLVLAVGDRPGSPGTGESASGLSYYGLDLDVRRKGIKKVIEVLKLRYQKEGY